MAIEQTMPAMSPTMTEGTIVSWKVKKGDTVKSGQVMAEIQTDKAVVEWECLDAGIVAEILIPVNTLAKVNQVAAIFTKKAGEDITEALAAAKKKNAELEGGDAPAKAENAVNESEKVATVATSETKGKRTEEPQATPTPAPAASSSTSASTGAKPLPRGRRVSPVAARVAAQHALDLSQITGTGPDGRIIRRDVDAALKAGTAKANSGGGGSSKPAAPKLKVLRADGTAETKVAMSNMRQIIGKRLHEAKSTIPHFYVTESIDAGALVALREQVNLLDGIKVTVNDFLVRASALALRAHPKVNATFHGTSIKQYDSADISVAVAIPDGLITPIVKGAHAKSVRQIGDEVRSLAKKAVDGKLQPAEFQGGSFTISNLGMFGISEFVAIINPPQVAILAVAGIKDEPVVRGGAVVAGKVLRVTLSADHRAVDGADAAAFLKTLRELLENPATLLV